MSVGPEHFALRTPHSALVEYEPRLVEEAVLGAVRGRAEEPAFRNERDRVYDILEPEARESAFRALHASWFERLGLGEGFARALREQPSVATNISRCLGVFASSRPEEGAELFVSSGTGANERQRRTVVVRLTPETLTSPDRLSLLLRHEFTHIADMLDPRFGYEPRLRVSEAAPAHEKLLQDRYRVLWDAFIDGRLARLGWAPARIRAERLNEFTRAFPMLGERTHEVFERFFGATSLTHAELAAFATDPVRALGRERGGPHPGERCPLCGFPTHAFEPEPERFPAEVVVRIRQNLPGWGAPDGLCQQCADLYRSRSLQRPRDFSGVAGQGGGDP